MSWAPPFPGAAEPTVLSPDFHETPDGSYHPTPRRCVLQTRHATDSYLLPPEVGSVLRVRLVGDGFRPFTFLEAPDSHSYWHLYSNGHRPATPDEARALLRKANDRFRRDLWFRLGGQILLYRPPVNSGELIVIDYEP